MVAIKSLNLDLEHDEEYADIIKEVELLSTLKSGDAPNVTAFYGTLVFGHTLWLIMEFCNGGSMLTLVWDPPDQMCGEKC